MDSDDRDKILLGKEVAGGYGGDLDYLSLEVKVGDDVDVTYSNGIKRTYNVKGVFGTKSTQVDQMVL